MKPHSNVNIDKFRCLNFYHLFVGHDVAIDDNILQDRPCTFFSLHTFFTLVYSFQSWKVNRVCAVANGFSNTRKLLEFRPWENEGSWEFQQHLIRDDNFYLVSCSTSFRVIHAFSVEYPALYRKFLWYDATKRIELMH